VSDSIDSRLDPDYRDPDVLKREGIKAGSRKHKDLLFSQDLNDDLYHRSHPNAPKKKRISPYLTPN
jgi:hypothetical protein